MNIGSIETKRDAFDAKLDSIIGRSEERRVGKECVP